MASAVAAKIVYVVVVVSSRPKLVNRLRKAFSKPAPARGHSDGRKIELISSMNRLSRLPFWASTGSSCASPSLVIRVISSYRIGTSLPMTTWNCPPAGITVMTPGSFSIAALSAFDSSFSFNRSRVAQCAIDVMLDSPPTFSKSSGASAR